MEIKGNIVVGQSGGPTAVINQSLVGIVLEARKHPSVGKVLGARHGIVGIMKEDFVDLSEQSETTLERVALTPAAALGSCRHKPTKEDCEKVFEVFAKHDVHYFFYIGGNDSAETASIINDIARERSYELRVFHVPKTIDNDLRVNDHTPGYGSAARYVALCFAGNDLDNRALPGVKIDIVMGRHAGWLTAASVLAKIDEKSGPQLVYLPERPVSLDKIADDIAEVYDRLGRCLVAISEGVCSPDGKLLIESKITERDSHGNAQLSGSGALGDFIAAHVKERLSEKYPKIRIRTDTLGYAQRSFAGCVSEVDASEARAVGEAAVKYAMKGDIDGSVIIHRLPDSGEYFAEPQLTKLSDVAKHTKDLPEDFINEEGNGVTEAYIKYAKPLIGKLPVLGVLEDKTYK
jgi:6-phosphofructokinase 1